MFPYNYTAYTSDVKVEFFALASHTEFRAPCTDWKCDIEQFLKEFLDVDAVIPQQEAGISLDGSNNLLRHLRYNLGSHYTVLNKTATGADGSYVWPVEVKPGR